MKRRKKQLLIIAMGFFFVTGILTVFGEKGLLRLYRLERELVELRESNRRIAEENRKLEEEARRLRHDRKYIEEIARGELGMVKEGEIVYRFDSTGFVGGEGK